MDGASCAEQKYPNYYSTEWVVVISLLTVSAFSCMDLEKYLFAFLDLEQLVSNNINR